MKLNCGLITTLALFITGCAGLDACLNLSANLKQNLTVTTENVLDCYRMFKLSDTAKSKTLKVIRNVLELYAFRDAVGDSPDPEFQPSIDILKSIRDIQWKQYKSEVDFQLDLMRSFYKLNDGHTFYSSECYNQFSFLQPFFIVPVAVPRSTYPAVYVHSIDPEVARQDLTEFLGARILQIDDVPISRYLQEYSDSVGVSKEVETRYQSTFAWMEFNNEDRKFKMRRGYFAARSYDPPQNNAVTYKVVKRGDTTPVKITVPWFIKPKKKVEWNDMDEYWKAFCVPKADKNLDSFYRPRRTPQLPIRLRVPYDSVEPAKLQTIPLADDSLSQDIYLKLAEKVPDPVPILHGDGFAFFTFTSKSSQLPVGVYKMSEFAWADEEWKEGMIAGFSALKKAGVKHLIVDMFNNGGGYICTSHALSSLLTSNKSKPFPTDFRLTNGMNELITKMWVKNATNSSFFPGGSVDEDTGEVYKDLSMIVNATQRTTPSGRKVQGVMTSRRFYELCDDVWGNYTLPFAPENIVVVSNGYCGSSCALTLTQIKEFEPEIKFVAFNALGDGYIKKWKGEWSLTSFPGSEVYDTDYLAKDVAYINSNNSMLDVVFPTRAVMSFTLREAWSRRNKKILEFMRWGTKDSVKWGAENVLRPSRVWEEGYEKVFAHQAA